MEIALIKLLLAHTLGDFFLQPNSWVAEKEKEKLRSLKLYLHAAIHVALIFAVFLSFKVWFPALVIGITHFVIDASKLQFQNKRTKYLWFFADQILHIIVIIGVWTSFYDAAKIDFRFIHNQNVWLIAFGALLITSPAAVVIRVVIAKFIPTKNPISLQDAGKFIGVLERLLVYVFVLTNHFEAVGFLLAAKSIFRFGDLKKSNDIKLTEYVLIGTLLSFGIALVIALTIMTIIF